MAINENQMTPAEAFEWFRQNPYGELGIVTADGETLLVGNISLPDANGDYVVDVFFVERGNGLTYDPVFPGEEYWEFFVCTDSEGNEG